MNNKTDFAGNLLPGEMRVTKIGKAIRQSSLDEMSQLLKVIMGNMSLVDPRPLFPKYLFLCNKNQKNRHLVKLGITAWAQINGSNSITFGKEV